MNTLWDSLRKSRKSVFLLILLFIIVAFLVNQISCLLFSDQCQDITSNIIGGTVSGVLAALIIHFFVGVTVNRVEEFREEYEKLAITKSLTHVSNRLNGICYWAYGDGKRIDFEDYVAMLRHDFSDQRNIDYISKRIAQNELYYTAFTDRLATLYSGRLYAAKDIFKQDFAEEVIFEKLLPIWSSDLKLPRRIYELFSKIPLSGSRKDPLEKKISTINSQLLFVLEASEQIELELKKFK